MADKCTKCLEVINAMGHKAPVSFLPFAWGPSSEDPNHYYVFPESQEDVDGQVNATKLCELKNPIAREERN
jgi:hypothetical protein